ncbi:MAG: S-methyl-5-thioribose-1-phosphate isomerase [Bacteroidetes bacterium]|nr:S-methyl-5-thioribose-1-phosphate isomerase [Bacteroidota bacterium]
MKVAGKHYRTIWMEGSSVFMIDQNALPFEFRIYEARTCKDTCHAIRTMITRGAGAIGAAAGFAMAQAFLERESGRRLALSAQPSEEHFNVEDARNEIEATRPTARNLYYATEKVFTAGLISADAAVSEAQRLAEENVQNAISIGEFGSKLIKDGNRILTHCNAGWLGFVDYGSALSPIYISNRDGKKVFVYADETRPRSQGARLTAWELMNEGISHSIVPDNAAAYLMSKGMVDMVITGADRIAANGDAANKIGTFEKAIIAKQFGIPFYIAAPFTTFDLSIPNGTHIVIEERDEEEVHFQSGPDEEGIIRRIRVTSPGSSAFNPAFDVTPAEYISGIITEKGIIGANSEHIKEIHSLIGH